MIRSFALIGVLLGACASEETPTAPDGGTVPPVEACGLCNGPGCEEIDQACGEVEVGAFAFVCPSAEAIVRELADPSTFVGRYRGRVVVCR